MTAKTQELKNYQRPPVVAILGHVDHGKTTLLDAIRKTDVVKKEYGGITQHIGAYQIEYKDKKITFIDTPGHAAFAKMRSQGASVTDLVVLVVAADDGVKPQTKESIAHIKQAKVPFLVAINKVDLSTASPDMVKSQLAENEVLVEGYGGDIVCVEVSAQEKKGLDDLLEMILLIGEMQNLKADPQGKLQGVVIDSFLDHRQGPIATILVKNGTLSEGDKIYSSFTDGKVKSMIDDWGKKIKKAEPAKPVRVLGFKQVVPVGAKVSQKKPVFRVESQQETKIKPKTKAAKKQDKNLEEQEEQQEKKIKIILKADTKGTLQAIKENIPEEIDVVYSNVGHVSDSDVLLSLSTNAKIYAFNVKIMNIAKKLADTEKLAIQTYTIIYELLEDLEKQALKLLEPNIDEEVIGKAKIIAEFNIKGNHIAGSKIIQGKIKKANPVHLEREGKILADAQIKSIQKEKKEIEEASSGSEIGLVLKPDLDFKMGDVIISYKN